MLDELISSIGYNNILDYLENNIALGDCVCIKLDINKNEILKENVLILDKKSKDELSVESLNLKNWCQKRTFYSNYLTSNKAVVCVGQSAKLVISCIKENITFNYNTFVGKTEKTFGTANKISMLSMFKIMIDEYCQGLKCYDEDTRTIELYRSAIENLSNAILDILTGIEDIKNKKIRIFIDTELDNYIESNECYLKQKIFDNATEQEIEGKTYGRYSGFISLNNKKPLLKLYGTDEISLCTQEKAMQYRNLLLYLIDNRGSVKLDYGEIQYRFNPKDCVFESFNILPYEITKTERLIKFKNILSLKDYDKTEEVNIANRINYLLDGFLYKETKMSKYATFRFLYRDCIHDFVYNYNETKFTNCKNKINAQLIDINKYSDNRFKMIDVINFILNINNYFDNDNLEEVIESMYNEIFIKIKEYKKGFIISNDEEFLFIAGQLAHFLATKSKVLIPTNKLINKYYKATTISKIQQLLTIDFNRYSYDENLESRINRIYSEIMLYSPEKDTIKNKNVLMAGLYADNLFYKSTKD